MFSGIVSLENSDLKRECLHVLETFKSVHLRVEDSFERIDKQCLGNILFFITDRLDNQIPAISSFKGQQIPKFPIIFYNRSLMLSKDSVWAPKDNLYFVVGDARKKHLKHLIQTLLKNHWRRIPYDKLGIDYNHLSARMKNVMEYIETNDLQKCDIFHLASYLKITPGYFSQLFKAETGQTFRSFMQSVLNYYENLLFLEWKLDVKSVSRLLGYSELSSYSRSFKNRKGQSPRAFAKLSLQP